VYPAREPTPIRRTDGILAESLARDMFDPYAK